MSPEKLTPMQAQWLKFRNMYNEDEYILAFRMGDFFEFFDDDAKKVAKILDITCTTRQGRPLAGFPYASGHEQLEKIVKTGISVVVVDQVEDPQEAKARGSKIVRRDVVRVITPGTVMDENVLDKDTNNFMVSLLLARSRKNKKLVKIGMGVCDLSTGEFQTTSFMDLLPRCAGLDQVITRYAPVEVLLPDDFEEPAIINTMESIRPGILFRSIPRNRFEPEEAARKLKEHFNVSNLEAFGMEGDDITTGAAGALLGFLQEHQKSLLSNITSSHHVLPSRFMQLDSNTVRNLELLKNNSDGSTSGALFGVFSRTRTTMGKRMMKNWLLSPLMAVGDINARLDVVEYFTKEILVMEQLGEILSGVCDLERLISRINYSHAINARHLVQLAVSLENVPSIKQILRDTTIDYLDELMKSMVDCSELVQELQCTFVDEPPPKISEGAMIRDGVHGQLDDLRAIKRDSKAWLERFQEEMREKHDITTLKVKKNKVFGYFIEVTKSHIDKVPDSWARKQTLTNSERYINENLKEMEEKILTAEEKIFEIEKEIFNDMRALAISRTGDIQKTASALAKLDVLLTFASVAATSNYCRPELQDDGIMDIRDGRHPTIEKIIGWNAFIPNDTSLDPERNVLTIVTGPNMSGKSTFLRQVCLIVILAQAGSFVPASSARIGIVDRLFSRVGASDDISRSRSTFLVEMNETAYILNHATSRSLVILDELGRGTSTFDGVSLAWAVAEFLHAKGVKTLFATHYHQLADLESYLPRVQNLNVLVSENENTRELVFLHKVEQGSCDQSYGIQVARLAGIPSRVLDRATEVLHRLSSDDPLTQERMEMISQDGISPGEIAPKKRSTGNKGSTQMTLIPVGVDPISSNLKEIKAKIEALDVNSITPLEALNLLKELKDEVKS